MSRIPNYSEKPFQNVLGQADAQSKDSWLTPEDIQVPPVYSAGDLDGLTHLDTWPGRLRDVYVAVDATWHGDQALRVDDFHTFQVCAQCSDASFGDADLAERCLAGRHHACAANDGVKKHADPVNSGWIGRRLSSVARWWLSLLP